MKSIIVFCLLVSANLVSAECAVRYTLSSPNVNEGEVSKESDTWVLPEAE